MECRCSRSLATNILVCFSGLFLVFGGTVAGVGILLFTQREEEGFSLARVSMGGASTQDASRGRSMLENASIGLIAGGMALVLQGAMGCYGAMNRSRGLIAVYLVFASLVVALYIAAVVLLAMLIGRVDDKLMQFLTESIHNEYKTGARLDAHKLVLGGSDLEEAWDLAQIQMECCGATGPSDWAWAAGFERRYEGTWNRSALSVSFAQVPISCCKSPNPEVFPSELGRLQFTDLDACLHTGAPDYTNTQGCFGRLRKILTQYTIAMLAVTALTVFIEVPVLVAAFYLCCHPHDPEPDDEDDDDGDRKSSRKSSRSGKSRPRAWHPEVWGSNTTSTTVTTLNSWMQQPGADSHGRRGQPRAMGHGGRGRGPPDPRRGYPEAAMAQRLPRFMPLGRASPVFGGGNVHMAREHGQRPPRPADRWRRS